MSRHSRAFDVAPVRPTAPICFRLERVRRVGFAPLKAPPCDGARQLLKFKWPLFAVKAADSGHINVTPKVLLGVIVFHNTVDRARAQGSTRASPQQPRHYSRHTGDTHQYQRHPSNPNHLRTARRAG